MNIKTVGFFKELEHGNEDGGSLKESICNHSLENEVKLVEYLESGVVICVAPGLVWDVIDESKGVIRNLEILTDGEWAWPSDLAYYVREYHVSLSEDFMEHVKRNEWTIANKVDIASSNFEL